MARLRVVSCMFLLVLMVWGCSSKPSPASSLVKMSDHFSQRMRWQDFSHAASFITTDLRSDFLEEWKGAKDLHVVGAKVDSIEMVDPETATVTMTIEYYMLPSNSVKQIETIQEWKFLEGEGFTMGSWELVSGVPSLTPQE